MSNAEKLQHYMEVLKRLEQCHKDVISITNANNPFSNLLENNSTEIYDIILLYRRFDKLRNGIKNAEKVQKDFEQYLNHTEDVIIKIRESANSLAETGLKFGAIEESKAMEFGKMIKDQFLKFKEWIEKKVDFLSEIKETIKDDMSYIEKEIQREFSKIK